MDSVAAIHTKSLSGPCGALTTGWKEMHVGGQRREYTTGAYRAENNEETVPVALKSNDNAERFSHPTFLLGPIRGLARVSLAGRWSSGEVLRYAPQAVDEC